MASTVIQVQGLTISFGGLIAVENLDFTVGDGEILSLIGPNGAGKTTVFNLVTGFLRPNHGGIVYNGMNITGLSPHRIAKLGIVRTFQRTAVFPKLTVFQNVLIGSHRKLKFNAWEVIFNTRRLAKMEREIEDEIEKILDFVDLSQEARALASNLSYGKQRLLEIAIALVGDPRVLLLDEPASGMNPEEAKRTMGIIRKINGQGVTVLLVEHNMTVVMDISDRIVVLDHGRKISEGSPDHVCHDEEVIKAYLGGGVFRA